MQVVGAVVARKLVRHAVEREAPVRDAVRTAPDHGAEVRRRREVSLQRIEAEDHVAQLAPLIRHEHASDDRAVLRRVHLHAAIPQYESPYGTAVGERAEQRLLDLRWPPA